MKPQDRGSYSDIQKYKYPVILQSLFSTRIYKRSDSYADRPETVDKRSKKIPRLISNLLPSFSLSSPDTQNLTD